MNLFPCLFWLLEGSSFLSLWLYITLFSSSLLLLSYSLLPSLGFLPVLYKDTGITFKINGIDSQHSDFLFALKQIKKKKPNVHFSHIN